MATKTTTDNLVPIGIVLAVAGYVTVQKMGGIQKLLSPGDVLDSDDHIQTGEEGELSIGFLDGSTLEVGPGTEAILDAEVLDPSVLQGIPDPASLVHQMQQVIHSGGAPGAAQQIAEQSFQALSEGPVSEGDLSPAAAVQVNAGQQPVGGDVETHAMPEMILPKLSISSVTILEPEPGKEDEDHGSDSEHGTDHTSGHDSGHDDTSHDTDSGHDDTSHDTDSGHDDSSHDSGGGHSAGQGGGYGYAGGSLSSVAVFTVTLSSPAKNDVRVDFKTVDGTAVSGGQGVDEADYGQTSGTLIIPAGQMSGTIEVTIYSDKLVETDEHFYVTLSNPVNAMIVGDTALGQIIDSGHGHGSTDEATVLVGTEGDDVLITKGGPDIIEGLAGNDTLISGGGPDVIHGGEGDDLIVGLGGPDELYGEEGNDEIVGHGGPDIIDGGPGNDIIYAGGAPDEVMGGEGDDFINAEGGPDTVYGGEGNDIIYGGGGPDTLDGGAGDDIIRGEGGPDILSGGPGNDELYGGGGPDILTGGEGADILKGGGSGDIFKFENIDGEADRILDFSQHDQIDLSAILDFDQGDPISQYVQITPSETEQTSYELSVNPTGSGNLDDFQVVAILDNLEVEPDIDQLLNNGNLVVIE